MKLYTEEQVLKFINDNFDEGCSELIGIPPIQLPSDEEIKDEAQKQWGNIHRTGVLSFIDCAKWMRDKIKGGNK